MNTGHVNASSRKNSASASRSSAGSRGGTGTKVIGTVVGIVVVLAVILGVAEFGTRAFIARNIENGIVSAQTANGLEASGEPSVSFGKSPVLPALATRNIQQMRIEVPSTLTVTDPAAEAGQPGISGDPAAVITGDNIDVTNQSDPVAELMIIETTVPTELLQAIANRRNQGAVRLSNMTAMPAENSFDIEFSSGIANAKITPRVENGQLVTDLTGASILGFNLDGLARLLGEAPFNQVGVAIGNGLTVESATVTDAGLALVLRGENLPLSTMSELHFS